MNNEPKDITVTKPTTPEDLAKQAEERKGRDRLKDFLMRHDNMDRFADVLGKRDAQFYVTSVVMQVAFKPELAECDPMSILKSALRAASLELSCDESLHQAQLVPYWNRKKSVKEAQLIIHYLGIVNLAQRTGKYKVINWGAVDEGMTIEQDALSGLHVITGRPTKGSKTIGYFAYYELLNGFRKSEYMTVEEIHDHAQLFSPSYNSEYSKWKDPKMLPYLEQKTVIRKLMKSADLSGKAGSMLAIALSEQDTPFSDDDSIDVEAVPVNDTPSTSGWKTPDDLTAVLIARPFPANVIRKILHDKAKEIGIYQATKEQTGLMVAMMEQAFAPAKETGNIRRSCIKYLWDYDSSKKMSGPQIKATLDWLEPTQDSGGAYFVNRASAVELHSIWDAELKAKGQGPLPGLSAESKGENDGK